VNDMTATVVLLIVSIAVVFALLIAARSRTWGADHSIAARRFGIVGGVLGTAVAVYWAGRFLRIWG